MINNNPVFVTACIEANNQLISELIEEIDSQPIETLKGKEKKRMYSFLRNINRPPKVVVHHNFSKLLKIALVAIFILSLLVLTVVAHYSRNYIYSQHHTYGDVVFSDDETVAEDYFYASYICHLDSYKLIKDKRDKLSQDIEYEDENGNRIWITTMKNGSTMGFDTEKNEIENLKVSGKDAIGVTNSDCIILVWSSGKYTTAIGADVTETTNIAISDLIKIAETRKKVK